MMHQARLDHAPRQGHAQRAQRQLIFHGAVQRPADHAARVSVQNHRQEDELLAQPDVGDIGPPELIDAGQHHVPRQVRVDLAAVVGIGGHDELPLPHAQQIVLAHQPVDPLRVHRPAAPAQFRGDPRPPVAGPFQRDPLDRVAQIHVRIGPGLGVLVEAVEAGTGSPGPASPSASTVSPPPAFTSSLTFR